MKKKKKLQIQPIWHWQKLEENKTTKDENNHLSTSYLQENSEFEEKKNKTNVTQMLPGVNTIYIRILLN